MKAPSLSLSYFKFSGSSYRLTRENVLVWGILFCVLLLILVLAWDSFLFYHMVLRGRYPVFSSKKAPVLHEQEIRETTALLEERKRRFDEILARP